VQDAHGHQEGKDSAGSSQRSQVSLGPGPYSRALHSSDMEALRPARRGNTNVMKRIQLCLRAVVSERKEVSKLTFFFFFSFRSPPSNYRPPIPYSAPLLTAVSCEWCVQRPPIVSQRCWRRTPFAHRQMWSPSCRPAVLCCPADPQSIPSQRSPLLVLHDGGDLGDPTDSNVDGVARTSGVATPAPPPASPHCRPYHSTLLSGFFLISASMIHRERFQL
jgi:hypothetical protein